jgi:hypothetical protein
MEWKEFLDPELDPRELLCEKLPVLHEHRLEQFRRFSSTALIFSVEFVDTSERYTFELRTDGAQARSGELIDFPQATARGKRSDWPRAVSLVSTLVEPADRQIERYEGRVEVSRDIVESFERFDGVIEFDVVELPDGGPKMTFEVVLNDYEEPPRAPRAHVTLPWPLLVDLAHGAIDTVTAARSLRIKGSMGLALDLGGFFDQTFKLS